MTGGCHVESYRSNTIRLLIKGVGVHKINIIFLIRVLTGILPRHDVRQSTVEARFQGRILQGLSDELLRETLVGFFFKSKLLCRATRVDAH